MKPKSTLRPLLAAIAGGSLLALSSASGETLPDPLTEETAGTATRPADSRATPGLGSKW